MHLSNPIPGPFPSQTAKLFGKGVGCSELTAIHRDGVYGDKILFLPPKYLPTKIGKLIGGMKKRRNISNSVPLGTKFQNTPQLAVRCCAASGLEF